MTRRTVFSSVKEDELRFKKDFSLFQDLAKQPLLIYEMSEFLNFSDDEDSLNYFSKKIRSKLTKVLPDSKVEFDLMDNAPLQPAISVTIRSNEKLKYHCIFLSLTTNEQGSPVFFPLLCLTKQSSARLTNHVHKLFERLFTCYIKPYTINNDEFQWILGIAINESLRRRMNDALTISFGIPTFSNSANIHAYLSEELLEELWRNFLYNKQNKLTYDGLKQTFTGIYEHLFCTYNIDLLQCEMKKIQLEGIQINCANQLKLHILSPEILYVMLSYIHSLIFERRGGCYQVE